MWTIYYKSEWRIKNCIEEIASDLLSEKTTSYEVEKELGGKLEGKTPELLQLLSIQFSGELSTGATTNEKIETKQPVNYNEIIKQIVDYFKRENAIRLDDNCNELKPLRNNSKLISVKGCFVPLINGDNPFKRMSNFEKVKFINWTANIGGKKINFSTSKENFESPTVVADCLSKSPPCLIAEIYGHMTTEHKENTINILPLFIGLEI